MDAVEQVGDGIKFHLSSDEALVFFDWLGQFNSKDRSALFSHKAEQQIMFDLEAVLEKILVEPFRDDYPELVKAAKENLFPSTTG